MKKSMFIVLFVLAGAFFCGNVYALETHIPHCTGGFDNWNDYLQANNNTVSEADFQITLYSDGEVVYSQTHTVAGYSLSVIDLKALSPDAQTGTIEYDEPGLEFRVSYENSQGGVAEFRTIDDLSSAIGLNFTDFTPSVLFKGLAVANCGDSPADVSLYAIGKGSIQGVVTTSIQPYEKLLGVHTVWFPEVAFEDVESIFAVSDTPSLSGIVICSDDDLSHLLFTPASPIKALSAEFDLTCDFNMDGAFTTTADAVVYLEGQTFSAEITTKKIGGAAMSQTFTIVGTVDGTTGTFTDQTAILDFGDFTETIVLSGTATVVGDTMTGSGTIESIIGGSSHHGTFDIDGDLKK